MKKQTTRFFKNKLVRDNIVELLKKEDPKNLIHDIKIAPVWIQKIMQKAL